MWLKSRAGFIHLAIFHPQHPESSTENPLPRQSIYDSYTAIAAGPCPLPLLFERPSHLLTISPSLIWGLMSFVPLFFQAERSFDVGFWGLVEP